MLKRLGEFDWFNVIFGLIGLDYMIEMSKRGCKSENLVTEIEKSSAPTNWVTPLKASNFKNAILRM